MTEKIILILVSAVVSVAFGFGAAWYWYQKRKMDDEAKAIAEAHRILVAQVTDLNTKLALLSQSVLPMNLAFQAMLVKQLTHFHTPRMDALLVKLGPPFILTDEEEKELVYALKERMQTSDVLIDEYEKVAAKILPDVIKLVRGEQKDIDDGNRDKVNFVIVDLNRKEHQ